MGFDIDEAIDIENWKGVSAFNVNVDEKVKIRIATEDDLEAIFNLIQSVGKEMEYQNDELFAYSKNRSTYLEMLNTGVCAVAVDENVIVASLLTCPADNKADIFNLTGIPKCLLPETLDFVTCQVLPNYRGNKLEQRLIDYIFKNSKNYTYAVCTIHPENIASLKSVQNYGFEICNEAYLYGGKKRLVLKKNMRL